MIADRGKLPSKEERFIVHLSQGWVGEGGDEFIGKQVLKGIWALLEALHQLSGVHGVIIPTVVGPFGESTRPGGLPQVAIQQLADLAGRINLAFFGRKIQQLQREG